jgi:FAD synthase
MIYGEVFVLRTLFRLRSREKNQISASTFDWRNLLRVLAVAIVVGESIRFGLKGQFESDFIRKLCARSF